MRPTRLAPLFATVRSLKGVGPKVEGLLNKLIAPRHEGAHARVVDLLWHSPASVIDRPITPRIAEARIGEIATLEVTVAEHRPGGGRRHPGPRAPYRVLVEDGAGAALEQPASARVATPRTAAAFIFVCMGSPGFGKRLPLCKTSLANLT